MSFYIDKNINQQSLNVSTIIQTDSNVTINDLGNQGQIDLNIDGGLVQQWKATYTQVINELRTLSIIPTSTSANLGSSSSPFNGVYCNGFIQPSATNSMTFNTNGAERLRITKDGNIGVGTTTPSEIFTVQGSSYPSILLKDTTNTADYMSIMRDHGANKNIIRNSGRLDIESPANYQRMTFLSNGNVGIATTTPTEKLDVVGNAKISSQLAIGTTIDTTYVLDVKKTGANAYSRVAGDVGFNQGLIFSDTADIWTIYKKATSKNLNIYNNTSSSDLMTFTSGNLVGIGTTTPATTLDVNGITTVRGDILPTSLTNIGSLTARMGTLFTTSINTTNAVVVSSDINKKKDIEPIEDGLSVVMNLKPKSFKLIEENSDKIHTGFIAQEVKDLFCENWAVFEDNQGSIGLRYTEVIPLNTCAIQQLNDKISVLEQQNKKLIETVNMLLRLNNLNEI